MKFEGGCYCGALRYAVDGEPVFKAQCHCRPCQYASGGGANYFMTFPSSALRFTKGEPQSFSRSDIDGAVTRLFCGVCGTQLASRNPLYTGLTVAKVGTMDDPSLYDGPRAAIVVKDMQAFHHIADGLPTMDGLPPARR